MSSKNSVAPIAGLAAAMRRPVVSRAAHIAFCLLLLYAAILTAPMSFDFPGTGLDASWQYALNVLPWSQYKFGTDVVFTYGPLGFVACPLNFGHNLAIALAIRLFVWALALAMLGAGYASSRNRRPGYFIAVIAVVVAHPVAAQPEYLLTLGALLLILGYEPEGRRWWRVVVPLCALAAIAFLLKATTYATVLLSFCAYLGFWYVRQRRTPSVHSCLAILSVVAAPFLAYLIYHPSASGLWAYVTGVAEIVKGYNVAMSMAGLPAEYAWKLLVPVSVFGGFAAYAVWRRWVVIETGACLAAAFVVTAKHGIVRSDPQHLNFIFALVTLLMGILLLRCRPAWKTLVAGIPAFACISTISIVGMNVVSRTLDPRTWNPTAHLQSILHVIRWRETIAFLSANASSRLASDHLSDAVTGRIGRSPVAVFPWEISYGAANPLNVLPLYTLQSYSAYTSVLDQETADHLLTKSPPDTRLLLEWKSVDGRHPFLDVPATWAAIFTGFAVETWGNELFLLKKKTTPQRFHQQAIRKALVDPRAWQNVPDRDDAVSTSVRFYPNIQGIVRKILYKIDPIYMEIEPVHGMRKRFRVVPDVLQYPIVLNCLPLDSAALQPLLLRHECTQKVRRFRFVGDGLKSFSAAAEIAFTEAPDQVFHFLPEPADLAWKDLTLPSNIAAMWLGNVELINNHSRPIPAIPSNPARMPFGENLEISGWATSGQRGESFDAIYLIHEGQQVRAITSDRPDVAQYYRNPRLARSGFAISVDSTRLPKGLHSFTLVGATRSGLYYRCPDTIYVSVE
jgi:hypothetical protein